MAAKGLRLCAVIFGRYEFEHCIPGEYALRLELLENMATHEKSQSYLCFLEETGAECFGSYIRWVYFRKKAINEPFDLFQTYILVCNI